MMRRLFFLLPNTGQVRQLAHDLEHNTVVNLQDIHAVARDTSPIEDIQSIQSFNETDPDARIERWGWRINLAVFFIALGSFVYLLSLSPGFWLMVPVIVMGVTFLAGYVFIELVPEDHIRDFFTTTRHSETLLMVDVEKSQVNDVSRFIQRRYPEAISGGVSWHISA